MKNLIKSFKENKDKIKDKLITFGTSIGVTLILGSNRVCAASNTESIDSFINFACDWLTKIRWSCSSSWWSNVCFADGKEKMQNGKSRGLMTLMARIYACCYCSIKKFIWIIEGGIYSWMEL